MAHLANLSLLCVALDNPRIAFTRLQAENAAFVPHIAVNTGCDDRGAVHDGPQQQAVQDLAQG